MELDQDQIIQRIDNFIREFESCEPENCEKFYRVSELVDLFQKRTGIFTSEVDMSDSLQRLSFIPIQVDDEFLYPVRSVL